METERRTRNAEDSAQLADARVRVEALLGRGPDPDLSEPNALARDLAALAAEYRAELTPAEALTAERRRVLGEILVEVTDLQDRVRGHVLGIRFRTLERIHAGLARLRVQPTIAGLIGATAEEMARCCDFDRTLVAGVNGSSWRAEAVWTRPDLDPQDHDQPSVPGPWAPLGAGRLETDLVRRRVPVLLVPSAGPQRHHRILPGSAGATAVAAPVVTDERVIGFLHAECAEGGRVLTPLDRDNLASFAEGFGLVFERLALLARLEQQRAGVRSVLTATARELADLENTETVLVRRDRESVAAVRVAAGLRKVASSPLDQLLTARERQVVELMVEGARNRQIADRLVVSEETVKSHVRSISRKLGATSRADAVSRYLRLLKRDRP